MKIVINPFSTESISDAISAIKDYQRRWLEDRVDTLVTRLAEIGANAAQRAYGRSVTVTAVKTGDGQRTIIAEGEAVCFIEFGTGVYAAKTSEHYDEIPFEVAPGSWSESESGAHTWGAWVQSGKPLEAYPYNHVPHPGMIAAYEAIVNSIASEAKKVFAE